MMLKRRAGSCLAIASMTVPGIRRTALSSMAMNEPHRFYSQPAYLPLLIWIWMTASFTAIMKVYSTSGLIGKLCALY
ncbi:MAG: hypothetical protein PHV90_01110 [Smithella sp.]|nr:hypothetical protein [Smithella sp.]